MRSSGIDRRDIAVIAAEVATAVDLAEGPAGVLDVLRAVARHEPIAVRDVSRHAELPVPIVAAICNELRRRNVVDSQRPVRLTESSRSAFAVGGWQDGGRCPTCDGRGIVVPAELEAIGDELDRLAEAMPEAKVELDQTHCTVDTKLRRVMLMAELGLLTKRMVFLGDDDLTSLSVAHALSLTGETPSITVVDVDTDVLAFIAEQARTLGVHIDTVEHDLVKPLPEALLGAFELVFTDPPYTIAGAELFLSRAASALAPQIGHHILFAFGARRPSETVAVQRIIGELGLAVRSLQPNFNDYVGAGILGGTSHMYHLRTTDETAPLIVGEHEGPLYSADGRAAAVRRYQCVQCKHIEPVGPGERYPRIADLKQATCPQCGSEKFRPLSLNERPKR
ncbi:bis-aminopropyl spermidine synthase family protein [Stackebrandtia soli]|uniref:bis-aminopropyl spermidine synthase family protein n=1 Tax=Stackebrandtia soli TaxID=1892856 RepID=UPI0039E962C6